MQVTRPMHARTRRILEILSSAHYVNLGAQELTQRCRTSPMARPARHTPSLSGNKVVGRHALRVGRRRMPRAWPKLHVTRFASSGSQTARRLFADSLAAAHACCASFSRRAAAAPPHRRTTCCGIETARSVWRPHSSTHRCAMLRQRLVVS